MSESDNYMEEREVEVKLSDQAEEMLEFVDLTEEEVVNRMVEGGFTIGGKEIMKLVKQKSEEN